MKPYRLINTSEMQLLSRHFTKAIQQWNDEYSVVPLNLQLTVPAKTYTITDRVMIHANNQLLATITGDHLSTLNQALFQQNKPCFNATSQKLIVLLVNKLLKTEGCTIAKKMAQPPQWCYAGSTCLILTIGLDKNTFTVILSPDWVYQQLPKTRQDTKQLHCFEDALADQRITLNLELIPSTFSVLSLAKIQAGDVITSDHLMTTPLNLMQGNQIIAQAELGQSLQHKSIILKRLL